MWGPSAFGLRMTAKMTAKKGGGGFCVTVQHGPPLATSRWHIGAKDLRGAITAYAKRFDLLEVRVTVGGPGTSDPDGSAPTQAALRRWRKGVPPPFDFSVVAGPELSKVKLSDAAERELTAARTAMDTLQARCFVLRTPAEVTPAAVWRDRIKKIVDRFPRDVTHVVWEPSGVWETEDAGAFAKSLGIVLAVDAAREPVPAGPVAYVRLRALGETRSFNPSALERIVQAVGERRDVYAILETDSAMTEGKRLRALARTAAKSGAKLGGGGRLVRPRGTIVVRDDEQE
jgi:uncharacterized protein YecE (DUF72 family)